MAGKEGGTWGKVGAICEELLRDALPVDAAERCSGNIGVAVLQLRLVNLLFNTLSSENKKKSSEMIFYTCVVEELAQYVCIALQTHSAAAIGKHTFGFYLHCHHPT
jgi:hypothetical protein